MARPRVYEFDARGRQFEAQFAAPWTQMSVWTPVLNDENQPNRFDDICGADISAILRNTGFKYSSFHPGVMVLVFDRTDPNQKEVVAVGVCQNIVEAVTQEFGFNISYFCKSTHEGMGLSKLATAMAVLKFLQTLNVAAPGVQFANIQCRLTNEKALGLAQRLGLSHQPEKDFRVPKRPDLKFRTYRGDPDALQQVCQHILGDLIETDAFAMTETEQVVAQDGPV